MKCYNDGVAVVVRIQLRKDGDAVRARNRYRKSWRLKNVMFTLETDPPRPAPTPVICVLVAPFATGPSLCLAKGLAQRDTDRSPDRPMNRMVYNWYRW